MTNLTFTDRILEKTILPFFPRSVTPNSVTWFRFFTIPFVAYFFTAEEYLIGLIIFFFSAFSDAVDGSLARTRGQVTEWGKKYDPVADKLLIGTSAFILISRFLNIYLAATIIILEIFIVMSSYYRHKAYGAPIQAEISGKIKMTLQSLGVGAILVSVLIKSSIFLSISFYLLSISVIFAIISLVVYKSI